MISHLLNPKYQGKRKREPLFWLAGLILLGSVAFYLFAPFHLKKFAAFSVTLGVFFALLGATAHLPETWVKRTRLALCSFFVVLVTGFLILEVVIVMGDQTQLLEEPDVMVILGAQVHPWGPSVLLADRLNTAYDYLEEHPDLPVVVSGGQGPDEHATEASVMGAFLESKGVSADRIWLEGESHNTKENLLYTRSLLEERGIDPDTAHLLVVSNGFHLTRVRMLAERQGLDISTLSAPCSYAPAKIQSYLREAPALVKSFLLDR